MSPALRLAALLLVIILTERHGASGPPPSGAPNCTLGPFVASGVGLVRSIAQLSAEINAGSVPDGGVICLQRGETWSGTSGLDITATHANSPRVIVCSSTGTVCTATGLANARILITSTSASGNDLGNTGVGMFLHEGASGFTFTDIDLYGTNGGSNTNSYGIRVGSNTRDITFDGGGVHVWGHPVKSDLINSSSSVLPTNYTWGVCPDVVGTATTCGRGQFVIADSVHLNNSGGTCSSGQIDEWQVFGTWVNTTFSVHISGLTQDCPRDHGIDIEHSGDTAYNGPRAANNLTIRQSWFDGSTGGGAVIDASHGTNLTVRDNVATGCFQPWLGVDTHGPDTRQWGWSGGDVYRNVIDMSGCAAGQPIILQVAQNFTIHDNLVKVATSAPNGNERGFVQFWCADTNGSDLPTAHDQIYNNTVYRSGGTNDVNSGWALFSAGNSGNCGGSATVAGTDLTLVNNALIDHDDTQPKILAFGSSQTCSDYGANGAQIHHDFVWTASGTPNFPACTADDDWIRGGATAGDDGTAGPANEVGTKPGLNGQDTAMAGDLGVAFTPTSNASAVCGRGDSTFCTQRGTDFFGNTCATCDIGAICCPP